MYKTLRKIRIIVIVGFSIASVPFVSIAQNNNNVCSSNGYTIETINGVFTDDVGARENRDNLKKRLPISYKGEPLTIDFLLNPTHSVLDLTDTAIQKTFEGISMYDPDLDKILTDASQQIKTQKVLVVAHSQGNFYANNFYKTVTEDGNIPPESIGVYSVGTPASYVAGEGKYLTSSTDKVIALVAKNVLPGSTLMANDSISYKSSDDFGRGHDFTKVYLQYRPAKIIDDILWSLDKLSTNSLRGENAPCLIPPHDPSLVARIVHPVAYAVQSTVAGISVAATTVGNGAVDLVIATFHVAVNTINWTYHTTLAVGTKLYGAINSIFVYANNIANPSYFISNVILPTTFYTLALSADTSSTKNNATVLFATLPEPLTKVSPPTSSITSTINNGATIPSSNQESAPPLSTSTRALIQTKLAPPKLVYIGATSTKPLVFGGGSSQVLSVQAVTPEETEATTTEQTISENSLETLSAPVLSVAQCSQSLATDGCLLATTTVRFEWTPVSGAGYYAINKNGTTATTTETAFDVNIGDFSDYIFSVSAEAENASSSPTSSLSVSVASIPIAINEIAWMGTVASANDEWFEIKNNTNHTIDLSQWELNAKDGTPHVKLSGVILPKEYLVFERTNDNVVSDVVAHQIYTGSLGNTGEQLDLTYASTTYDQTPASTSGEWVSGTNSTSSKQTMERYSSTETGSDPNNWGANLVFISNGTDAEGNLIDGTPEERNSVSYLINKGQDITTDTTLTAENGPYVVASSTTITASTTLTIEPGVDVTFYEGSEWLPQHTVSGRTYIGGYSSPAGLEVEGTLNATGTPEKPIVFESLTNSTTGSLNFKGGNGTSTLSNVYITNTNGITVSGPDEAVVIMNSEFSGNTVDLNISNQAEAKISSSTLSDTKDIAIEVYNDSTLSFASSTINGSKGEAIRSSGSTIVVSSSTIKNTAGNSLVLYSSTSTIVNSVIGDGDSGGIVINGGAANIATSTISGFTNGEGINVTPERVGFLKIVPENPPVIISNTEIIGNETGLSAVDGMVDIAPDVSIHDNVIDEIIVSP